MKSQNIKGRRLDTIRKRIKLIIAPILYYSGFFALYKRLFMKSKVTVLMFHRVTDTFFDISLLVKKKTFEACMQYISQNYPVISMDFLAQNLDTWKNIPQNSFVITFDDGWIDFHDNACPVLSRLKIPATVYLTTGFVSSKCNYWQERLNNLLIPILADKKEFSDKDTIISIPEIDRKLKDLILKSEGKPVIFQFIDFLKKFPHDNIVKTISDLELFLKKHAGKISENKQRSFANWDELNSIKDANISFGSHTVNHPILTNEQANVVREEIRNAKKTIEVKTGRKVLHFSYPNGAYNENIRKIVSESHKTACTTKAGFVTRESDIYELNRIGINEEMITDGKGRFPKYLFLYSIFIECLKAKRNTL